MAKPKESAVADRVFSALADQSRRKVIELLHQRDMTILDLSPSFDMSFQALSKHIKILESAGIINKKQEGKYRVCSLNHQALSKSLQWISYYSNFWNESLSRLETIIANNNKG